MTDKLKKKRWSLRILAGVVILVTVALVGLNYAQKASDGPYGSLLPGGEMIAGELVTIESPDWSFISSQSVELQLVEPTSSRWVGAQWYNERLYIPCDLGFMWARLSGMQRHVMHAVYRLKRWHTDAVADGRAVLRVGGNRYPIQLNRVQDETLVSELKANLEVKAREFFEQSGQTMGPAPTAGPRDIWFFEVSPRRVGAIGSLEN